MPNKINPADHKLIGKNYATPDLMAKVTGKAKYAEDYRADGMLFCKLLLSPMPHARVRRSTRSAALAMPGVKAILTMDDLPAPADSLTDNGTVIRANKLGERGLTMEPVYQGEPILAVAAVDELTAAEAIEKIQIDYERLPFVVDPLESLRSGQPECPNRGQCLDASVQLRRRECQGQRRGVQGSGAADAADSHLRKWSISNGPRPISRSQRRQAADGQAHRRVDLRRRRRPASRTRRWCSMKPS